MERETLEQLSTYATQNMCCPPQNLLKYLKYTDNYTFPTGIEICLPAFQDSPSGGVYLPVNHCWHLKLGISSPYFPKKQGPVVECKACLLHTSTILYHSLLPAGSFP